MLFFQRSVILLGHVLSAEGISAKPDKVKNWLVLMNAKELHISGVIILLSPVHP